MTNLLVLKEQIKKFYARYGAYVEPVIKFIVALFVHTLINSRLGFNSQLSTLSVVLMISLVCAFLPYGAITIIAGFLAIGQIFAVSKVIAAVILVVYIIVYCLAIRYTKSLVNVLLAVPIFYILKIPYVVPILMGMVGTPAAALPTGCGVILYYMFYAIKNTASAAVGTSMEDSLGLYKLVIDTTMANYELVFFVILFTAVVMITYFIRKRSFDHAFEIGIAGGTIACILGVLIGKLVFDISGNTVTLVVGGVISGIIVYIICSFRMTLDYTTTEHLQFEDDDYYYYVKAVPKVSITAPEKNVKRINPQKVTGNTQNLQAMQKTLRQTKEGREYLRRRAYERDLEEIEIDKNNFDK